MVVTSSRGTNETQTTSSAGNVRIRGTSSGSGDGANKKWFSVLPSDVLVRKTWLTKIIPGVHCRTSSSVCVNRNQEHLFTKYVGLDTAGGAYWTIGQQDK